MQRNWKLIKHILAHVEREHQGASMFVPEFEDYTRSEVHYHVFLCVDADFLMATTGNITGKGIRFDQIYHLTWAGHNELDRLRQSMS